MNIFRRVFVLLLAGTLLILAGCQQQVDTSQPPEIAYGQDACHRCKMIISEENMAAAYWTAEGKARRFDDIGEMMAYYQETAEEVASWWVHDLNSSTWLRAEEAFFVAGSGIATPMGYGIVALADRAAAEALSFGAEDAVVLDFSGLLTFTTNSAVSHNKHQ